MISNIISDFKSQRMYGGVGGALSDGRPYPYLQTLGNIYTPFINFSQFVFLAKVSNKLILDT